jgi:DNA-binding protein HU-beta
MNKSDLIAHIAAEADLSKAGAARALDAVLEGVQHTLKRGGTVTLTGFGSFSVTKRAARMGRNPKTGEPVKIKARKVPKFTAGKLLKESLA